MRGAGLSGILCSGLVDKSCEEPVPNMIANGLFILTLLCNDGVRETGQAQLPSDLLFRLRQAAPRFC